MAAEIPAPAARTRRVKTVRAASAALTLAAVGALGLVASESGGTVTRHDTVSSRQALPEPSRLPTPRAITAPADVAAAVPVGGLAASTPLGASAAAPASPIAPPPVTSPSVSGSPAANVPSPAPVPVPVAPGVPACPLPLPSPTAHGGLQSLIPFAPVFGPFSSEAFAAAPTFQPLLELFGPFLVAFAQHYAAVQPSVAPWLDQLETLENEGYGIVAPLYAPDRSMFLTAETNLATALAPVASSLVDNPASACVIDAEGVLTAAR